MLRKLVLENYGRHESFVANFRPGLNGILGTNGSGKSTILSAAHFALTGESLGDGNKDDDLKFGAKKGKVVLTFEQGGNTYEVSRGLGTGARTTLKGPGVDLAKAPEVNQALSEILRTNKAVLTNNIFARQGTIDQTLDHTSGERLKELQQIFGLSDISKIHGLLGTELSQYRMTPNLEEQLVQTIALLEQAQGELSRLESELTRHREVVQSLEGPSREIIEASEKHHTLTLQRQQARDTVRHWQDRRGVLQNEAIDAGKAVAALITTLGATPTPEAVQVARQSTAALQRAFNAQAAVQVRRRDLEAAQVQLAHLGAPKLPPEAFAALVAEIPPMTIKLQQLESILKGQVAPELHPLKVQIKYVADADAHLQSFRGTRPASEREIELRSEIKTLIETLAGGTCPTCRRPFDGHADATHSADARLEAAKVELSEASRILDQDRQAALEANQKALASGKAALAEATAKFEAHFGKMASDLRDSLAAKNAVAAMETQHGQLVAQLQATIDRLQVEVQSAPPEVVTTQQILDATTAADGLAASLAKITHLTALQVAADKNLEGAQQTLAQALKAYEQWAELPEPPAPDSVQIARQNLEIVSARTQSLQEGYRTQGTLQAKIAQMEMGAEQFRAQIRRESRDRAWVDIVTDARDAFHVSQYPSIVMQEYAGAINARIAHYLEILSAPFKFWLDRDSMVFMAEFPDRRHVAARLSGAERIVASISFRLALADTFASHLSFVALDEPSAFMDESNIHNLQNLFLELKRVAGQTGRQIILITHEPKLTTFVDHVVEVG